LAVLVAVCSLTFGCGGEVTPEIIAGIDGCSDCGMVIDRVNEACGWTYDGQFVSFCSPSCLLAKYDALRRSAEELPHPIVFADYHGGGFSSSEDTAFLLTDHVPTVMDARVICFASVDAANDMRQHDDEVVTDWMGYRVHRGEPDRVIETVFSSGGMDPEAVSVSLGDIVLWRVSGAGLEEDLEWAIKGYPEVGPTTVPAAGNAVELRFMATRPGAGFPIESPNVGQPLGMLKVSGAHTADEAAL
jgi:hypothetical protein